MKNERLLNYIFTWLKTHAAGRENIVTVKRLESLFLFETTVCRISDLRRFIVDNLPVASTTKGLFYPIQKSDLEAFEHHIKSRIFTMWKRMKRVSEAYPELTKEGQLDLFKFEDLGREVTK